MNPLEAAPPVTPPDDWWRDDARLQSEFQMYETVRAQIQAWHGPILNKIARAEYDSLGRKLDLLKGKTLVFRSEEQAAIFMDYLVALNCPNGTTATERFLKTMPPTGDSGGETWRLTRAALAGVRYTFLQALEARPEYGVVCDDLLAGRRVFLMDRSLSKSLAKPLALATAVFPVQEWIMASGAALPLPTDNLAGMLPGIFKSADLAFSRPARLDKTSSARLALTMIQLFLNTSGLSNVRYGSP